MAVRTPARRSVLVVDDDEILRELLALALAKKGYRVLLASGDESMGVARREQPSLILLDLHMADRAGTEVSRRLHDDSDTAHIPVVAIGAEAGQARTQDTIAHDWLRKPFPLAALYRKVARWA